VPRAPGPSRVRLLPEASATAPPTPRKCGAMRASARRRAGRSLQGESSGASGAAKPWRGDEATRGGVGGGGGEKEGGGGRSALEGRGLERQPPCSQGARQPGSAVGEDTRGGGGGEGGGKKGGGGGGGGAPGLRQARDTSRPYPSHFPPRSPPKLAWDTHRLGRRQLTNTSSGGKPSQRHISTSLIAEGLTAGRSRGGVLGLKMLHYSR
ncbi:unnamed protein product, partial [Prorocentrum cordatum]